MPYAQTYETFAELLGVSVTTAVVLLAVISIWTLIWKGLALWKSAKKNSLAWFIVLLIVNTLGILEILYIYVFSEIGKKKSKKKKKKSPKEEDKDKKDKEKSKEEEKKEEEKEKK